MSTPENVPPEHSPVAVPGKTRFTAPTLPPWANIVIAASLFGLAILLPAVGVIDEGGDLMNNMILAGVYVVMALGLNIIVGFAGLLDLGYVAFFAIGAYTVGYFASGFHANADVHIGVGEFAKTQPGIHVNFLIVFVLAIVATTIAGMIIGLPTLRLRGDYIAIVTLAFGEIIGRLAINGDEITFLDTKLTAGRQGVTPVDTVDLPIIEPFRRVGDIRPWFYLALVLAAIVLFVNFRLRDSRLGRAWIAVREDEVAAASMGVPLVKTKLLAYGTGAAFGGVSGALLSSYNNTVNADQFQFSFSIFILAMVILGGLGSIWGVVLGAIALSVINNYIIPKANNVPDALGLDFDLTEISFGIFGFLLLIMMVLRPEGLLPERRRKLELKEGIGGDDAVVETRVT